MQENNIPDNNSNQFFNDFEKKYENLLNSNEVSGATLFDMIQDMRQEYHKAIDEKYKEVNDAPIEVDGIKYTKDQAKKQFDDALKTNLLDLVKDETHKEDYEKLINETFKLSPDENYKGDKSIFSKILDGIQAVIKAIITTILKPLQMAADYMILSTSFPGKFVTERDKENELPEDLVVNTTSDKYKYQVFKQEGATETVIYFHGNGESINQNLAEKFPGKNVIAMEYPSYTGVPGSPTKANLQKMMDSCWKDIKENNSDLVENKVTVVGYSVGGYCATKFAKDHPESCKGLILANTYSNTLDILPEPLNNIVKGITYAGMSVENELKNMPNKEMPIVINNAKQDDVFNDKHAERNKEAASKLHNVKIVETDGGHGDVNWDECFNKIEEGNLEKKGFLKKILDSKPQDKTMSFVDKLSQPKNTNTTEHGR